MAPRSSRFLEFQQYRRELLYKTKIFIQVGVRKDGLIPDLNGFLFNILRSSLSYLNIHSIVSSRSLERTLKCFLQIIPSLPLNRIDHTKPNYDLPNGRILCPADRWYKNFVKKGWFRNENL